MVSADQCHFWDWQSLFTMRSVKMNDVLLEFYYFPDFLVCELIMHSNKLYWTILMLITSSLISYFSLRYVPVYQKMGEKANMNKLSLLSKNVFDILTALA
jgi:hypothetical protein